MQVLPCLCATKRGVRECLFELKKRAFQCGVGMGVVDEYGGDEVEYRERWCEIRW